VRFGVVGTGTMARRFAAALMHAEGAALAAVASRSSERAARFAARCGGAFAHAHGSYEALLADDTVDVVYVATPHHRHRDDCLAAIAARKAVLCEKPFARDAAEAREVIAAARRQRVFCMEAMWTRFVPAYRRMIELVARGELGDPRLLVADFSVPVEHDPANRFFNRDLGGGALLDRGVYVVAMAHDLFGPPVEIQSMVVPAATGVDAQAAAVLRHAGGRLAVLTVSLSVYAGNEAVLAGTRGRLRLLEPLACPPALATRGAPVVTASEPDGDASLTRRLKALARRSALLRRAYALVGGGARRIDLPPTGNGYVHEIDEVVRCIRAGRTESGIMPLDHSYAVLETLDAIRGASRDLPG
jgi:predicted dehydrogenase